MSWGLLKFCQIVLPRTAIVLLAGLVSMSVTPSVALEITAIEVTTEYMDDFTEGSQAHAKKLLANHTALVKIRNFPKKLQKYVPVSGVSVMYFGSNGTVLTWSSKSKIVEKGKWRIEGKNNNICLYYPQGLGYGICTKFFLSYDFLTETTAGNPFKLKAGSQVPFKLGRFGVSLNKIAKKIN